MQVDQYVERLEKQLPSKAEMAALLSDINQAGVGRGLQFELFKPGQVVVRTTTPSCRSTSRSPAIPRHRRVRRDMANLPRIVTLNNLSLVDRQGRQPELEAVAKTFRYLDQEEADRPARGARGREKGQQRQRQGKGKGK